MDRVAGGGYVESVVQSVCLKCSFCDIFFVLGKDGGKVSSKFGYFWYSGFPMR